MHSKFSSLILFFILADIISIRAAYGSDSSVHAGSMRIMAVGDSITEGLTPSGPGTPSYRKEFVRLLSEHSCSFDMVGSKKDNRPPTHFNQSSLPELGNQDTDHEAYSGQSAQVFINATPASPVEGNEGISQSTLNYQPQVVLLHIGSNDMNAGDSVENAVSEIGQIVDLILDQNSTTTIFVANVIPWYGATSSNNSNSTTQQDVINLGNAIENATFITNDPIDPADPTKYDNVYLVKVNESAIPPYDSSLMQSDGIHPNAAGELYIAQAFVNEVMASGVCGNYTTDTVDPTTNTFEAVTNGSTTTFTGNATDVGGAMLSSEGSRISRVEIAIRDGTTAPNVQLWWDFTSGGYGPIVKNGVAVGITNATLSNHSINYVDWGINVVLPPGDVRLYARAVDTSNNDAYTGHTTADNAWPVNQVYSIPDYLTSTTLISPSGSSATSTPTYQWNAVANSTWYFLSITDSSGASFVKWYTSADANCGAGTGTCSVTPTTAFSQNVEWRVRTWNQNENGPWSSTFAFTVNGNPPAASTLISPTGNANSNTPTYTWNAVSDSTWYYLSVSDSTGTDFVKWYTAADANCAAGTGTCSVTPTTFVDQTTDWKIRTWNQNGNGPWSSTFTFFLTATPPAATTISPSGNTNDSTPTYEWNAVTNSTWYYLWVSDDSGPSIKKWYRAADAACGNGTGICAVTPPTSVTGNINWWVQTWNSSGYGPWSSVRSFTAP